MCVLFDIIVFNNTKFDVQKIFNITGQDVGIYYNLFKNRYKVTAIPEMIDHYYDRETIKFFK